MSPDDALRAVCLTAYATAAPYSFGTNPKRRRRDPRAAAALRTQVRLTACEAYLLAEDEEAEALLRLINAARSDAERDAGRLLSEESRRP